MGIIKYSHYYGVKLPEINKEEGLEVDYNPLLSGYLSTIMKEVGSEIKTNFYEDGYIEIVLETGEILREFYNVDELILFLVTLQ